MIIISTSEWSTTGWTSITFLPTHFIPSLAFVWTYIGLFVTWWLWWPWLAKPEPRLYLSKSKNRPNHDSKHPFPFFFYLENEDGRLLVGDVKSIKCQMLSRRNVTSLSATGHTTIKHQPVHWEGIQIPDTLFKSLAPSPIIWNRRHFLVIKWGRRQSRWSNHTMLSRSIMHS